MILSSVNDGGILTVAFLLPWVALAVYGANHKKGTTMTDRNVPRTTAPKQVSGFDYTQSGGGSDA